MGQVQYNQLFNIEVVNNFYQDGNGKKDIALTPTAETVSLMKTNTILFRDTDQSSTALYRAIDNSGTPLFSFGGFSLVYSIQLLNLNEFLNFTLLTGYSAGKILYFTNKGTETSNNLTYSVVDLLRPAVFTYNFPQLAASSSDRGHLQILDAQNNDVTPTQPNPNNIVPDATSLALSYPLDLRNLPKGLYTFKTWTTANPTPVVSQTVYIDTDLAKQGVFGIVDLHVINYTSFPTDRTYKMNFTRRTTQWNYYVVLKSGTTVPIDSIAIIDSAPTPQLPYPAMTFTRQSDTVINGITAAVFTGDQSNIPFFELPKKSLDINRNGNTIAEDITGPTLGVVSGSSTVTEMFVFI